MDSNGTVKYLNNRKLPLDENGQSAAAAAAAVAAADNCKQIEHLVVEGLFEEESQERKSSISFDKIKQISLTYSLQSDDEQEEEEEEFDELAPKADNHHQPIDSTTTTTTNGNEQLQVQVRGGGGGTQRRDSHGSFSLSPVGDEEELLESSRKVSVIEVKDGKRQWPVWAQRPNSDGGSESNTGKAGDSSSNNNNNENKSELGNRNSTKMPSRTATDRQPELARTFQSPYLTTNPLAYEHDEHDGGQVLETRHYPGEQLNHRARRRRQASQRRQPPPPLAAHLDRRAEKQRGAGEIYFRPNTQSYLSGGARGVAAAAGSSWPLRLRQRRPVSNEWNETTTTTSGDDNYSLGRKLLPGGCRGRSQVRTDLTTHRRQQQQQIECCGSVADTVQRTVAPEVAASGLRRLERPQPSKSISLVLYNETDANIIIDQAGNQGGEGSPANSDDDVVDLQVLNHVGRQVDEEELLQVDDEELEDDEEEIEEDEEEVDEEEEDDDNEEVDEDEEVEFNDEHEVSYSEPDLYYVNNNGNLVVGTAQPVAAAATTDQLAAGSQQGGDPDYLSEEEQDEDEEDEEEEEMLIVRTSTTVSGDQMVHNGATDTGAIRDLNMIGRQTATAAATSTPKPTAAAAAAANQLTSSSSISSRQQLRRPRRDRRRQRACQSEVDETDVAASGSANPMASLAQQQSAGHHQERSRSSTTPVLANSRQVVERRKQHWQQQQQQADSSQDDAVNHRRLANSSAHRLASSHQLTARPPPPPPSLSPTANSAYRLAPSLSLPSSNQQQRAGYRSAWNNNHHALHFQQPLYPNNHRPDEQRHFRPPNQTTITRATPQQLDKSPSPATTTLIGLEKAQTGSGAARAHQRQQQQPSLGRRLSSTQRRSLAASSPMRPLSGNQQQVEVQVERQQRQRRSDQMTADKVSRLGADRYTRAELAALLASCQRPPTDRQPNVAPVAARNEKFWSADLYDDYEFEFDFDTDDANQDEDEYGDADDVNYLLRSPASNHRRQVRNEQQQQQQLLLRRRAQIEYERAAALYATPVRSPRTSGQPMMEESGNKHLRRLTCDNGEHHRRLNIFISSPQRRPVKRRIQQQQQQQLQSQRQFSQWSPQKPLIWTNSSPSTGSRQDSCYVSNGQPSVAGAGGGGVAGNGTGSARISQAHLGGGSGADLHHHHHHHQLQQQQQQHQPSPASSIGSQSCCWSNYGSYTRASDTDHQVQVQAQVQVKQQQQQQQSNQQAEMEADGRKSPGAKLASSSGSAMASCESKVSAARPTTGAAAAADSGAPVVDSKELPVVALTGSAEVAASSGQVKPSPPKKPIKLKNLLNGEQVMDNLYFKYQQNNKSHGCSEMRCLGSMINAKPVEYKVRSVSETLEHAKDFINNFYASIKRLDSPAHKTRLKEIEDQLNSTETYYLKETELIYGAKLAWRNASRCIGRIQWSKLQVFDARFTTTANEMFEAVCNHIKYATNKGSLRSAITILPQRVKSTKNDWRIWNSQLIGWAGYRNKETGQVIGDPANADFTEVCQKLGWKGKGTRFDVLPIVLSANGGPPQLFPLPEELVLRVKIRHPKFKCFEELDLQWYALPAVANMMLDVGGLQFTAAPFSGWYMVTEIGARDLGDANRYNILEQVAQKMGLNTTSNMSLWKDQALVELNIAVLDSFQQAGVTIVDHHTATDTFMTHLANEQRLRGGCPADWVWLVPPMSGSATQVFHQEMVNYHLLPNYEYMDPVWKNFDWVAWEKLEQEKRDGLNKKRASLISAAEAQLPGSPASRLIGAAAGVASNGELTPRKLRFKEIARAVKFTSKLFGKALSRRIKATILYATETGKSERFANKLAQTFSCVFNVHLMSMSDYDMTFLEHEALLLIVTSTFGNGDPPESGELFAKHLAAVKLTGDTSPDLDSINSVSTNPFFQMLSEDHKDGFLDEKSESNENGFLKVQDKQEQATHIRPLSNVRFGVFALGSTAYPHFCAYGRYVDQTLGELGAERILKCTCGDELSGQEKAFNEWSNQVFRTACDVFCLTDTIGPIEERPEMRWSPQDVRFVPVELISDLNNNSSPSMTSPGMGMGTTSNTVGHITYGSQNMLRQSSMISAISNPNEVLGSKKVIVRNLMNITNKKIIAFNVKERVDLHEFKPIDNLQTFSIELESDRVARADSETTISGSSPVRNQSANSAVATTTNKQTPPVTFKPGDHIAIYPVNKLEMVEQILDRMKSDLNRSDNGTSETNGVGVSKFDFDQVYSILVKREKMDLTPAPPMTQQGVREEENWISHDRLPVTSFREALIRYMDITSPPNQEFLLILSHQTSDIEERKRLQQMARNFTLYEEWKNKTVPTLLSVLQEFKTIRFEPALITQIPLMKPRFYSVSGTSIVLTVGVVRFKTLSGELREGLCSNYLNTVDIDPQVWIYGYVRSAPAFHMPQDKRIPIILISAGTGMAPFRSFWQKRYEDMRRHQQQVSEQQQNGTIVEQKKFGRIEMYFGCRNSDYILYKDELDEMYEKGVLSSINIAFSRPRDCDVWSNDDSTPTTNSNGSLQTRPLLRPSPSKVASIRQARKKMYVQDKLLEDSDDIYRLIMLDGAHIYVCGDVAMADGVYKTLANIFNNSLKANKFSDNCDPSSSDSAIASGLSGSGLGSGTGGGGGSGLAKSSDDGESVLMNLRNLNRYHEDIFGAKQMS